MRTSGYRLGAIVLALLLGRGVACATPEIVPAPKKTPKAKPAAPWLDLERGLEKSRKGDRPIVLLYAAAERAPDPADAATDAAEEAVIDAAEEAAGDAADGPDLAATFETYLRDRGFKKTLRDFVLIWVAPEDLDEPFPPREDRADAGAAGAARNRANQAAKKAAGPHGPPPESVREKLVLHEGKSTLLVLSFREQVVARHLDELPSRSALRRELTRIFKVNRVFAREDRRVGGILEKSLYAFEAGKRKAAVELVLPFTKPNSRIRMDDTLKSRVDGVIEKYRKVAETEMKKGDLLDDKRKYKEALDAFEVVLQDFPFPDIRKQAAIRKGEIWREIQLFTRIPR